ncbi:LLM class flavin-dependent oxidoreductase [Yinghuangia aomiensis]|uniref:LLM class flavin-dependent oxidoreductase n=1 Tax=Yinghuangia aomiensis TaxID=676205 RepID=A0ABP9HU13_9ACTN
MTTAARLRFGLSYLFRTPPDDASGHSAVYRAKLEQIALAEALGIDDIWVGEHHFVDDGWLPSPLTAAAAIAAVTNRVGIGTNALLPALHHPIRLAEDAAVVDNISGGRLLLGVALGYRAREFEAFGVPHRERAGRLEEAITIMRRCWTESAFSHTGRHFAFEDVRCTPTPVQRPIPIWIGAAEAPAALRRAATMGDGWLSGGAPRPEARARYLDLLGELGRDAGHPPIAASSKPYIFVTRNPERDWAELRPLAIRQTRTAQRWFAEAGQALPGGMSIEQLTDLLFLVDTPENVAAAIVASYRQGAYTHHIHTPNILGLPVERSAESVALFATEVVPAVRARLAADASEEVR